MDDIQLRSGILPPDPPADALTLQRRRTAELQDLKNNPVKNNDRGWAGRLGDILRQFVISAGTAYGQTDPKQDPGQRLMSALGGGLAGGLYGGFHPEVDEERQRFYDIVKSKQIESDLIERQKFDQASFKAQQETLARQQNLIQNQPVPVTLLDGRTVYTTGKDIYGQDQSAIRQQAGFQNQAENQKRGQDFQRLENQKTRENNYNIAVASAQTTADRDRIHNEIQADRDYASSVENFYKRKSDYLLEISKIVSGVGGSKILSDTMVPAIQANIDRARTLDDQIDTETSKGSRADRRVINDLTSRRDSLLKQIEDSNQKLAIEAGKAGANASQIEALQKAMREDVYPTRRTVPKYNPTIPQRPGSYSAQGKVYPSPSALRGAFPGKSDAEIRQIVEAQGGRFQQ